MRKNDPLREMEIKALFEAELSIPDGPPPADLCAEHARSWREWRKYPRGYDPSNPREAGGARIMDSRTSHVRRRTDWFLLARQQMTLVENACRSGRSPECSPDKT